MTLRVFGIKIKISFLFVALLSAFAILDSFKFAFWGLFFALLHEMGHILVMVALGSKPSQIKFSLFDIDIKDEKRNTRSYIMDIYILLGGSAANLTALLIVWTMYSITNNSDFFPMILQNLFLCVFNMLPIESLDGGQIFFILMSNKFSQKKSNIILKISSFLILLPMSTLGFFLLLRSKYNFSLLLVSLYLMLIVTFKRGYFCDE